MPPATSRPSRILMLPGVGRLVGDRPQVSRRRGRRPAPLIIRDPYLTYTAALSPIAALVILISRGASSLIALAVLAFVFVGAQLMLAQVPARIRPLTSLGWSFLRLAVALFFVAGIVQLAGGPGGPLDALFIPVVVGAAAIGPMQAIVIGGVASLI